MLWSPYVVFPTGSQDCLAPVELVLTQSAQVCFEFGKDNASATFVYEN
jgi:hypothetical protein